MNRPPRSIQNDLAAKTGLGAIDLPNPPCGRRLMEVHQLRYRAKEAAATTPVRVDRDQQLVQAELRAALDAALEELPAHYRAVIVLHDVEGLSMAEAAASLGITVATAKTRAHRGRLFLRKHLSTLTASMAS